MKPDEPSPRFADLRAQLMDRAWRAAVLVPAGSSFKFLFLHYAG